MALVLAPEPPLDQWMAALNEQIAREQAFFVDRPILVDWSGLVGLPGSEVRRLLANLVALGLRVIGTDGTADPTWPEFAMPFRPLRADMRPTRPVEIPMPAPEAPEAADMVEAAPPAAPESESPVSVGVEGATAGFALLVDRPVRSGQAIHHLAGDVTILGTVASGAEIVAGGSLHVYGALRGRAIAGAAGRADARIFCRRMEAELVAINGVYVTADEIDPACRGRPVLARFDQDSIVLDPIE